MDWEKVDGVRKKFEVVVVSWICWAGCWRRRDEER